MTPREEFRRAIADETATIRAINTALRGPIDPKEIAAFQHFRSTAVQRLRDILLSLYAFDAIDLPTPVHKPPRSARRSPRSGHA